jgi:hypothetical protein
MIYRNTLKMFRGKVLDLDLCAECYGLARCKPRHWYWPFKESDRSLRKRLIALLLRGEYL